MKVKIFYGILRPRVEVAPSTDQILIENRFEFEHIR